MHPHRQIFPTVFTPYINPLDHIYLLDNNLKIVSVSILDKYYKSASFTLLFKLLFSKKEIL